MGNQDLAKKIIELIGGKENIHSVAHCATRLRIIIVDKDKINSDEIENLDKVKGSFFNSGQFQIILGTGLVNKVYDEVMILLGDNIQSQSPIKKEGNRFQRSVRIFGDVFVPIIPVLVATGLFMGLRGLLTQESVLALLGLTPDSIPKELLLFTQILTDTAFAFLPALVCWSTFRIFGGNPVLGIVLGLMLVNPVLPNAYKVGQQAADPLVFFGFIKVVGYQGSVLPAFITGIVGAKIEKFLKTKIPDSLDLILTPFLTLLFGITLALFVIGPIFHEVELLVLYAVQFLLELPFGIGGLIYGSFGQLLGIFGIHHILNFLEINMLSQTGWNMLNPIGTCGNMAQAGAVLAVGIKTFSPKMKQIAYPASLSATLGITEPAVFGVNLRLVKPFVMSMIGGGVGGFLASILQLKATGMALTGIPGTLLYLNNQLPLYILVNVVAFSVSFVLTYTIGYKPVETGNQKQVNKISNSSIMPQVVNVKDEKLYAPVTGKVMDLSEVNDPVFSKKLMGDGFAVTPSDGQIVAPVAGTVSMVQGHAVGLNRTDGLEVLVHLGIDTVSLKGAPFSNKVKVGDFVNGGDPIVMVDWKKVTDAGLATTTMVVITNTNDKLDSLDFHTGEATDGACIGVAKAK
ncbi:PTS beta-glucoside transporter subunit EIIBCA [Bacillus sp. AFS076308]|uniref:PTS beta-glucoside transporter subunit IIBCA n=1 Tax=unclassified Bacillus (in: firmicutes) TaxID=185979 RepID=UPI000BF5051D|nr:MULTISPECIES: PTS beta-glucoside transporter subunit IIBCA [unclassified Bacillus (in: firmicutes)]PFN83864.1 PTS beta-glucoside transporter subunit EIIBCA [Bacillus sp. AFS076308]PGV55547.1 PTS beta-glucoside transporter subunit EIIBCA [Bacillus sp. AFS037270]